jgi:hypothetical protein
VKMSSTPSPRRLEAQLMVDHPQLPSAHLASVLSLPADEGWDVGQSYRPSRSAPEQQYQFSRWALRETVTSLDELSVALAALAQRVQAIEHTFQHLPAGTTVSLTLFVTETDTVMGMGIAADVVALLARIRAGIEISLVVMRP